VSPHRSAEVSDEEEEVGGRRGVELRFVTLEEEEEGEEAGPMSDIRALVLRYCHGYRRGCGLCVCAVVIVTAGKRTHIHQSIELISLIM